MVTAQHDLHVAQGAADYLSKPFPFRYLDAGARPVHLPLDAQVAGA